MRKKPVLDYKKKINSYVSVSLKKNQYILFSQLWREFVRFNYFQLEKFNILKEAENFPAETVL